MDKTTARLLERATEAVNDLCDWPFPEESAVDVIGTIQTLVKKLDDPWGKAGLRQKLMTELAPAAVGDGYKAIESRSAVRSYNTNGLLAAFGGLAPLVEANAVELKWRWSDLQRAADRFDVALTVAKHEIADGDPEALIGEVWKSATKVVAKDQGPEVRV